MRDSVRHFVAELIGTFALVFISCGVVLASKMPDSGIGWAEIAIAGGLAYAVMVTATMRISGHLNPAVTLGFVATQRIGGLMAGIYIVAQLLGAMIAAYALKALFPAALYEAARGGGQFVALDVTSTQAYLLEGIATFLLVFAVFGTVVDPRAPKVGGFGVGLAFAANLLVIGPLTGAAMNPARAFGPAVASGIYEGQFIYWIGPIIGGVLAALVYEYLLLHHGVEPVEHGPAKPV
jgi:MIP family channel proteins